MSDFDELLSEVLATDVSVSPPDGMERRIKVALHAATQRRGSERRYPWMTIAAMILVGCVGMLAVRYRNVTAPTANTSEERSIAKTAGPNTELVPTPAATVSPRKKHSGRSALAAPSERPLPRAVASIVSLEVENLVIRPIEVASLASDEFTKQSTGWRNQQ